MALVLPDDILAFVEEAAGRIVRSAATYEDLEALAIEAARAWWVENVWPGLPEKMPSAPRTEQDVEALRIAGYMHLIRVGIVRGLDRIPNSTPFIDFMDLSLFHLENEIRDVALERWSPRKRWKPQ